MYTIEYSTSGYRCFMSHGGMDDECLAYDHLSTLKPVSRYNFKLNRAEFSIKHQPD